MSEAPRIAERDELLANVDAAAKTIRDHAEHGEELRHLPEACVEADNRPASIAQLFRLLPHHPAILVSILRHGFRFRTALQASR